DLLVLSFVKENFKPGVVFRLANFSNLCRGRARAILECHASTQSFNRLLVRNSLQLSFIDFFYFVTSGRHEIGEFTVIGQKQQAFIMEVELADGIKPTE